VVDLGHFLIDYRRPDNSQEQKKNDAHEECDNGVVRGRRITVEDLGHTQFLTFSSISLQKFYRKDVG